MNKFHFYSLLILVTLGIGFSSCEKVIDVKLEEGESQLVVDGFIKFYYDSVALNSGIENQVIKLRKTTPYLDNAPAPPALGAIVKVTDALGRTFDFKDENNDGDYEYSGPFVLSFTNPPMGFPGNFYLLDIKYNGEEFTSQAYMDSVPTIDSLSFALQEQTIQGPDTLKAGYIIDQILTRKSDGSLQPAKDVKGEGTCYWFKTFKNDVFYNKPGQMNLAYDAAFGPGSDNVAFIPPIVFFLSPERFQIGEKIRVECWSIGLPAYYFLTLAQIQMTNEGLFATPPSNVPTNITNKNKDSKIKAVGWFGAASVTRITQEVK
ncbi:MAG TPA: DUF4249 family protein [Bacteroidia bacterium]|nr:DUF4249 family protein [Bacteroidia bacterium]